MVEVQERIRPKDSVESGVNGEGVGGGVGCRGEALLRTAQRREIRRSVLGDGVENAGAVWYRWIVRLEDEL